MQTCWPPKSFFTISTRCLIVRFSMEHNHLSSSCHKYYCNLMPANNMWQPSTINQSRKNLTQFRQQPQYKFVSRFQEIIKCIRMALLYSRTNYNWNKIGIGSQVRNHRNKIKFRYQNSVVKWPHCSAPCVYSSVRAVYQYIINTRQATARLVAWRRNFDSGTFVYSGGFSLGIAFNYSESVTLQQNQYTNIWYQKYDSWKLSWNSFRSPPAQGTALTAV